MEYLLSILADKNHAIAARHTNLVKQSKLLTSIAVYQLTDNNSPAIEDYFYLGFLQNREEDTQATRSLLWSQAAKSSVRLLIGTNRTSTSSLDCQDFGRKTSVQRSPPDIEGLAAIG